MDWRNDDQAEWQAGEKCLAPYSENDELCEAVVKYIEQSETGVFYAVVSFSDLKEKKISLSQLCKVTDCVIPWNTSMFDDEDLEKPFFPDRRPLGPSADFPLSDTGVSIPYTINRYLRDYQRVGVQFLYQHFIQSSGCILGDDMGLGKTIQVISFLAAVLHKKGTREDIENNMPEFLLRKMKKERSSIAPKKMFLIVSPLSVLFNWRDELQVWGYFKVTIIHGSKKDFELSRLKQGKYEIALTTYETLRLCLDELNSIDWSAVIVDEVHRVKNPKTRVTQVMKDLRCQVRIGLTGTILQNNMEELWCVMDWAVPRCLGSKNKFKEEYSNPVEYGQRHNATKRELATGRKIMQKLARNMSQFFLRRTKALISSQLPKKEDRIVYCSLSEFQKAVYQTVLETEDVNMVLQSSDPCSCNSGKKRRKCCYRVNKHGEKVKDLYFSYLAILRKVANHAALLQSNTSTSKKQKAHINRVCSEVFSKFPEFVQQSKDAAFETISDPKYSGKMKVLQQLLNHCRKNKDKVLLFSFSTKLLDVLERYCMASGLDYRRLDGATKAEERVKIVKEFNRLQDVNICLVSTMAGGLGLNFVGANVVVVFDPTWNPANDLQAIDRAYRIGQCRDVKVFRLISLGTVEEMIYLRQLYKQQLHCAVVGDENAKRYFEAVQGSKEHKGELFGIKNLFKLRTQGTCLTREILEREGHVEAGAVSSAMCIDQRSLANNTELAADTDNDESSADVKQKQKFPKETFDFSSDSDGDGNGSSRLLSNKSNATTDSRKQLTLQHCGFSKLLEREPSAHISKEVFKEEVSHDKVKKAPRPVNEKQKLVILDWNISTDSEEESVNMRNCKYPTSKDISIMETEISSEDGENIVYSTQILDRSAESSRHKTESNHSEESELDDDVPARKNRQKQCNSSDLISDESDDIEIPKKNLSVDHLKQTKALEKHLLNTISDIDKNSQTIDAFSSSDDDNLQRKNIQINKQDRKYTSVKGRIKIRPQLHRPIKKKCSVAERNLFRKQEEDMDNERGVKNGETYGSLDRVLDGVKEVAYVHSNQNVVGSSKAENDMSRWAVRDVFELNQFSQLPANIMVNRAKTFKHKNPTEDAATTSSNLLQDPVTQKQKKVHHTNEITYLIGETPKAMQRKHFEEMVKHFNMDSTEEFARYVLTAKSDVRQDMLREFYSSQYSDVKDLYPVTVPVLLPVKHERETALKKAKHTSPVKKRRNRYSEKTEHKKYLNIIQSPETDSNYCCINNNVNKCANLAKQENVTKNHQDLVKSSVINTEEYKAVNIQKQTMEHRLFKEEISTTKKLAKETDCVTDLLGDTSILDDLFSSQTNRHIEQPARHQCEVPVTKVKHRSKDFWDILNEQNDDSLSRLTDLSVIEKVCESTVLSSSSSSSSSKEKANWDNTLWMKNDKFLWRKHYQNHD
ncbi:LOW QUALITY PROTEIN: DNA excision repair protein ERCC-6-like 2 [Bombina bombina]|uniref:LOW QUALITY PROTEIN: DNA excision repair protein ERCC-6-like 2 n=1 Tax=Bombina bombina TaxID=8345 RepID=UPI00235AC9B9|nr:LOW QUALITY PROTEIN: DNA excision repair protein ERCC-6-like 2 [Bombina bombina]